MPHGAHRHSLRRSLRRDLGAPLTAALGLRLALLALTTTVPSWDGVIYVRAAEQLAHGEGYTLRILDAHNAPRPTAFYPVGYPALLALLRLAGGGLLADRLLQIACSALLVPLAYALARRAAGRAAGRRAAWLAALWPGGVFLSATWLAEPAFALAAGVALLPLAYARRRRRLAALAVSAVGLGAVAYLRASALPVAACVALILGYGSHRERPRARRVLIGGALAACAIAAACLPLTPWVLRNARLLGAPVLVSTNDGVNLLLGARGEGSFSTLAPDEPCKRAPLGEVARSRCYTREALAIIGADPLSFAARGLLKLAHTYGHDSAPAQCFNEGLRAATGATQAWRLWALGSCRVAWIFILAAALAGAADILRRRVPVVQALLLGPVLAIAVLHATFLGGDRYHAAVAPMLLALAGIGLPALMRARPRCAETI